MILDCCLTIKFRRQIYCGEQKILRPAKRSQYGYLMYNEMDTVMSLENQELRKAGLKVTLPRVKILQIMETSVNPHLSAEDVYRALLEAGEDVGLATVYRVLTQFETAGLVIRHNFDGGHSVFELSRGEHHDHMVCMETGKVIEFYDSDIENLQKQIVSKHGYELVDHSLILYVRPKKSE